MINVLMVGPARTVKGGMTTVVDNYFKIGLGPDIKLNYIETINDHSKVSKFLKEIKGINEFKNTIKEYDIVHIHMASRRSAFRKGKYVKIAKDNGKKVILHIHGGGFKKFYETECNNSQKDKIKRILNSADCIIVLSEEWKLFFSEITTTNIVVIPNGVEVPVELEKPITNKLLFLGRITKDKGVYDLLESMQNVIINHPDIQLDICGSGEDSKLIKTLNDNKLQNNINFCGWLDKESIKKELISSSILILPSYYEAMPMSILEAMAYSNVVIATKVGSIPSVITDKKTGLLFNAGDTNRLSELINCILDDKTLKEKIAIESKKLIEEKYSITGMINKTLGVYNNVYKD